jgi:phosphotransferase family enzyme
MPRENDVQLAERIRRGLGARGVELGERIQSLWGGYGELRRAELVGAAATTAIVKIVTPPAERDLGRDAEKLRSHRRKLRSYRVELAFYQRFAERCDATCPVPALLHGEASEERFLFVLSDLDRAGFSARRTRSAEPELGACLGWLAAFHARFLGVAPDGLWQVGSYWHLATRPDELSALTDRELQRAAPRIDERLNRARFQTFVHGDAKLENFCFSPTAEGVAAVDFQYVGRGVGVKDVAYCLTGCFSPKTAETAVPRALDLYFTALRSELARRAISQTDREAIEREWRELFPLAWADFHRFLLGWAPSYAANDPYSQQLTREVLASISVT